MATAVKATKATHENINNVLLKATEKNINHDVSKSNNKIN